MAPNIADSCTAAPAAPHSAASVAKPHSATSVAKPQRAPAVNAATITTTVPTEDDHHSREFTKGEHAAMLFMLGVQIFEFPFAVFTIWRTGGHFGFAVGLISFLATLTGLMDYHWLPFMKANIRRFVAAGYTPLQYWGSFVSSFVLLGLGLAVTMRFMLFEAVPRWEADVFVKALIAVLATDVSYFQLHRLLHRHTPGIHQLHHLCVDSSMSAPLFMHPLDFVMEFVFQALVNVFVGTVVFGEPWVSVLGLGLQATWYSLAHDPVLRLPHHAHHQYCDSHYTAYTANGGEYDPADKVRAYVFANEKKMKQ